jgi:hypothetical protein
MRMKRSSLAAGGSAAAANVAGSRAALAKPIITMRRSGRSHAQVQL